MRVKFEFGKGDLKVSSCCVREMYELKNKRIIGYGVILPIDLVILMILMILQSANLYTKL